MESKEEKINRLRAEREEKILSKKNLNKEFYFNTSGALCRKTNYGEEKMFVGMPVRVLKPDQTYRNGIIDSFKIENGVPKIIVVCGEKKIKFEKNWFQVCPDDRLKQILYWEKIEVPERIRNLSTSKLLREYRQFAGHTDYGYPNDEVYKKELYLREHVGGTNKRAQKK